MLQYDSAAFPRLNDEELACLAEIGEQRTVQDGQTLIEQGQKRFSFFAIESGEATVVENSSGKEREIVVHGPREFTGDVDMLTERPALVTIRARGACDVIEVTAPQIRRMLGEVPGLSDKLLDAFQLRRQHLEASDFLGIRVLGRSDSKETLRIREFFYKNKVPHSFWDIETDEGRQQLAETEFQPDDVPIIACNGHVVSQPELGQIAECLGISREIEDVVYDVIIVGAGPSGLAAAVYGASEGLATLCVDGMGPGGQAGQSSKIENYMGFPSGLSGADLANRGYLQALKFGAEFTAPVMVRSMSRRDDGILELTFCTRQVVPTRTVLIATGASYQRLPIDGCQRLEGAGVYYSATSVEARVCHNATAVVIGGGNSAGQAALFLSQHARQVKMLLRGDDLRKSMSDYLATRIEQTDAIDVLLHSELTELTGGNRLSRVAIRNNQSQETTSIECSGVFIFVGAKPHTDWLPDSVAVDESGFVLTGPSIQSCDEWPLERTPCELETTWPGVFAVGDVRSGTTKRCAFAVGDGALGITCVHQHLSRE